MSAGFFRGAAVYTLSSVLCASVPFLLMPALTRALSPAEYGVVAMFATLISIASAIVGLSVHGSVAVRFFEPNKHEFPGYVSSCIAVMLATLIPAFLIMSVLMVAFPASLGVPGAWPLVVVVIAGLNFMVQLRLTIWLAQRRAGAYATLQVFSALVNAGMTVYLVLFMHQGAEGRMVAQAGATLTMAVLAAVSLYASGLVVLSISKAHIRESLQFGLPIVPHVLGAMVLVSFDRFVITDVLGLPETGVYMVAVQIALLIALVSDAVNKAFVPWLYSHLSRNDPNFHLWIVKWTWKLFAVILALGCVGALMSEWLVEIVAGEKYATAQDVLPLLILGQAFGAMYFLVANYVFYAKATKYLALSSLLAGVLNACLTVLLVGRLGIIGAGLAFLAAQAALFAMVWWWSNKVFPLPWLFWRNGSMAPVSR